MARGEDDTTSDIDLLVDLAPGADLFDLASLDVELERLLGRKVDIVPARMLKPHVTPSALRDAGCPVSRRRRKDSEHLQDATEHLRVLKEHLSRGDLGDLLVRDAVRILQNTIDKRIDGFMAREQQQSG